MDKYSSYSALAESETEGVDFEKIVKLVDGARAAVIAPHAGGIEPVTGLIAKQIASEDFSLYCFRGCKANRNRDLHITSHRFDEPECIRLIARHQWVVAIHGCKEDGSRVFLGGRDKMLISDLISSLAQAGINGEASGHGYLGTDSSNVCNRGMSGEGVQFELTLEFRNGGQIPAFVNAVRAVLLARTKEP